MSSIAAAYSILGISWCDHATNEEVTRRAGMERLQAIVSTRRREIAGHVLQMQSERHAPIAIYLVQEDGRRKRVMYKKTWRSTFKEDLEEMCVRWHGARRIASERWRLLVARCSESRQWTVTHERMPSMSLHSFVNKNL